MAKSTILTATGHVVSHAAYVAAISMASDGGGIGTIKFFDALTAASATTTNEVWRMHLPATTGENSAVSFTADPEGMLAFDEAIYCSIANASSVSVAYVDRAVR